MFKTFKYRRLLLGILTASVVAYVVTLLGFASTNSSKMKFGEENAMEDGLSSLANADEWINSGPLSSTGLRGKVVLVNFWTYTCINWLRALPYVRAWANKYKDYGLVVIGVHTPEFEFEKKPDNVRRYVKDLEVDYPVAVDSDYDIWNAFKNQYWPALYFMDGKGKLRHHKFGEGDYQQSEKIIQQLLTEAGFIGFSSDLVSVDPIGTEAAADWKNLNSPENYLGFIRTQNFSSPENALLDERRDFSIPARLGLNSWALSGDWTMRKEAVVLNKVNGRILYRFQARDLHLVMGGVTSIMAIRFRIRIDGMPPGAAHGIDVDEEGNGIITGPRIYQLVRQPGDIEPLHFEIEFLDAGAEVFAFTFG